MNGESFLKAAQAGDASTVGARLREECYAQVMPGVTVRPEDNFFELGGDSIMLIRLVSLVQLAFGIQLDALRFFEEPTLAVLTEQVAASLDAGDPADAALAAVLQQVEAMSDDEVDRLLEQWG
ncbi:acyl carrier protein [Paractinoplanes hotanensis]|uniref:Phosphopantetheine-binding protein n=1 Tax=Paractinoplanes hotanensis TaxID=2906497 RepID=A0ABT0YAS2_9ACTN|nr:phosphopantetheine-binding protein [Actinoplanes hotanensis]MCM4083128.1 phosphopantetheine-binding protein [Actinoplanes hotanensis]